MAEQYLVPQTQAENVLLHHYPQPVLQIRSTNIVFPGKNIVSQKVQEAE